MNVNSTRGFSSGLSPKDFRYHFRSSSGPTGAAARGSPPDTLSGGGFSKAEGAGVGIPLRHAIDGKFGSLVAD